jgi:Flp pilus assembly protein TadD
MGLLLVRRHDYAQALPMLHEANTLAPDNARYAYVYAVALNQSGDAGGAIALLERTHQAHPGDWDVLSALTALTRQSGDGASALRHAREMAALRPADPQVRALVKSLVDPAPR